MKIKIIILFLAFLFYAVTLNAQNQIRIDTISVNYFNGITKKKEIKDIGDDPSMFTELDDTKIAAGFKNGNIIIYEDNMTNSYSLVGHNKSITGVVKIKDDFALSCSVDTTMKVWNLTTLECEETFVMNKFEINYMIKLNDNKIVTCINENNLDIWNFESFSN